MTEDLKRMRTLMLRLEAAVSRIEDVADLQQPFPSSSKALENVADEGSIETRSTDRAFEHPATVQEEKPIPQSLKDFDTLCEVYLTKFFALSVEIGSPISEQAHIVKETFQSQRDLVLIASQSIQPPVSSTEYLSLFEALQVKLMALVDIKDRNRPSQLFNHLSTVADGMSAAGWVAVVPAPAPFVAEMKESAQFYGNRVIKEYKDKVPNHLVWVRSFTELLTALHTYVKEHHTTGLAWNPAGQELKTVLATFKSSTDLVTENLEGSVSDGSAPPPPPPGPPPPPLAIQSENTSVDMNSVFADLNKGSSVTAGLKKVDRTQMTHKNPALRAASIVPDTKKPAKSAKPASLSKQPSYKKKPTRKELEGTKWIVENYQDDPKVIIEGVELNHTVYVYNCKNSTIQINGKFNALSLDSCTKTGVVVDTLVSSIDMVKSNSFALQVLGKCPTVICDVCDSGQIYLSSEGLDCEIVTSKCGSININIPNDDGDFKEEAVPEMLKHKVVNGKLETSIVVHAD